LEHIAGRAFRTILVEARAAATAFAVAAARQCQRAAGAEHEKSDREECREALLHVKSLVL
jgi:hypothetical protein